MKRKRGNKKGKQTSRPAVPATNEAVVNLVSLDKEDNSGAEKLDDDNNDNDDNNEGYESAMEVDTPSSTGADQPLNLASINPDGSIDKTAGKSVGRVKGKLKTSKVLEPHSDTDKSSPQLGLEKQGVVSDKMEDTGNSLSEAKTGVSGKVSKKPGSIKIKSSKVVGGSSVEKSSGTVKAQDESLQQKEPRTPHQESQYNKQELDSALSVIKKVMKMDAAEPFNVPVNPEALGIPDYFDTIDAPMDFGTMCSNLEKGDKYMNSEDVYRDIQYIWDNCHKYNNKGDHILDLMRRVKKNFMKYWTAAGLFTEQSRGPSGAKGTQGEDVGASSQGHSKTGQYKQKNKKRHGLDAAIETRKQQATKLAAKHLCTTTNQPGASLPASQSPSLPSQPNSSPSPPPPTTSRTRNVSPPAVRSSPSSLDNRQLLSSHTAPQMTDFPIPQFTNPKHQERCHRLLLRLFLPNKFPCFSTLRELGLLEEVQNALKILSLEKFVSLRKPSFKELTLEFLSSLRMETSSTDTTIFGSMYFTLFGKNYQVPLTVLNKIFGFEFEGYRLISDASDFVANNFWREITNSEAVYNPRQSKSTAIVNPVFRYLHRFFSYTLCGREHSNGVVSKQELFFLWCLARKKKINFGYWLGSHLVSVAKSESNVIVVGTFVTGIAEYLEIFDSSSTTLKPIPGKDLLDMRTLQNMRMVEKRGDSYFLINANPISQSLSISIVAPVSSSRNADDTGAPIPETSEMNQVLSKLDNLLEKVDRLEAKFTAHKEQVTTEIVHLNNQLQAYFDFVGFHPPSAS